MVADAVICIPGILYDMCCNSSECLWSGEDVATLCTDLVYQGRSGGPLQFIGCLSIKCELGLVSSECELGCAGIGVGDQCNLSGW